jgi:glycosyltransferase involved in cell wall biosynthesis
MHILIIVNSWILGGGEINLIKTIKGLRHFDDMNVTVACPPKSMIFNELINQDIALEPLQIGFKYRWKIKSLFDMAIMTPIHFIKMKSVIKRVNQKKTVDVIVVQFFKEKVFATISAKMMDIPIVWFELGVLQNQIVNAPILLRIYKALSEFTSKIVVVSEAVKMSLIKHGIDAKKIAVIPVGIDDRFFSPRRKSKEKMEQLGLTDGQRIIGITGQLTKGKGQDIFLKSMEKILKKHSDVKGIVLGDGPELSNLKQLAKSLHIENNIIFPGFVNDVPEYLSLFDMFINSSYAEGEGLPTRVLEAMFMKIPIITTEVGGIAEVIKNLDNGIIIEENNEDSLVSALELLLNNKRITKRIVENGYLTAKSKYLLEENINNTHSILNSAIAIN